MILHVYKVAKKKVEVDSDAHDANKVIEGLRCVNCQQQYYKVLSRQLKLNEWVVKKIAWHAAKMDNLKKKAMQYNASVPHK